MRPVKLDKETISSNVADYPGIQKVPFAASMGMRAIWFAGAEIYFLVNGTRKAAVLKEVMEGPITDRTPASRLRKTPNVHYIFDDQAWHDEIASSPIIDPQVILQRMIDFKPQGRLGDQLIVLQNLADPSVFMELSLNTQHSPSLQYKIISRGNDYAGNILVVN